MAEEIEGALNEEVVVPPTATEADSQDGGGETPVAGSEDTTNADTAAPDTENAPVPYVRFKEINDELGEFKKWSPYIEQLRTQFQTPEAVAAALEQQQQQSLVQQQQGQVQQFTTTLQQQVDRGEKELSTAQAELEAFTSRLQFQQMSQQYSQFQAQQQLAVAKTQYPNADFDTVLMLHNASGTNIVELAKQSHDKAVAMEQRILAQYNATKAKAPKAPEGTGGNTAPRPKVPSIDDPGFDKWFEDQARATLQANS